MRYIYLLQLPLLKRHTLYITLLTNPSNTRFTECELAADSQIRFVETFVLTEGDKYEALPIIAICRGQWMLMSGSHFSDFINRTLWQVINAPHSSVIGWWAEQTATVIDQTRRPHICCFGLHGRSLPRLRALA